MPEKTKQKSTILEGVNLIQEKAISFTNGPLLIIAGAGTGKTTVLTRRIAWLIDQGFAKPEEILALTFTEKAAAEMNDRVDQLMPLGYAEINISTFHAFAQQILLQHALDIGLPGDFKVLSETQAWMLMQKNLDEFKLDYYRPMGNPNKFIHSMLKHFQKAKGEGITIEAYMKYAQELEQLDNSSLPTKKVAGKKSKKVPNELIDQAEILRIKEMAGAFQTYQKMLLDLSYLDFGDLINYTLKLFQSRPKILKLYQSQFKYILIDEFQDTDLSQYEMVKLLANPKNNITVVGDDDQSIYKFRGASISNILKFKEDFPKASEITLTDNYRSTQPILDLAYDFIQLNNPERLEAKLKISKKLISHINEQGQIKVLHSQTVHQEATSVAEKILELSEQGLGYNDFAILVRANDHAEPFISELNRRGIPFMYVANRGLYKKPFILDLLAYLKLLDNYHESENLFRILNIKKFKVESHDLINLSQISKRKSLSLFEVIKQIPGIIHVQEESYKKIAELLILMDKHANLARFKPVSELLIKVLEDLHITKDLGTDTVQNVENRSLLQQFYGKAQNFETEADDKTLKSFLNQINLELDAGDTGELAFDPNIGPEAVKVMTVHSSKGLEFKCVFIVNMVEARFPSRDRREQIEIPEKLVREILSEGDVHLMEERRLFYVAITRAKQYFYLTWADDYGGSTNKKPSRFLIDTKLEDISSKSIPTGTVVFKQHATLPLKTKSHLIIPESFSWTSISSFLKCPLEYKYKYLYQLPFPGNGYTSFGQTIHKTIQLYSKLIKQINSNKQTDLFGNAPSNTNTYPSIEKLHQIYNENWIDDWYENKLDKEKFRKRGYRLLENYYNQITTRQILPQETEKFFKLKLGDYKYVGVIDSMYANPDGSVNIVDYKTSQKARTKLEKVDKKQLLAYQWAAQDFLKKKVGHLSYWDLEDLSNIIEFSGSEEDIKAIKEEFLANVLEIVETIKTDSFYELDIKKSHDCEFRDYESY
ncbi:MAG: ATP-dependent helicase [Candidatus Doudnabacteria bacterium]|nr:ATP-dependent helicase [Candidatus Doudnabacteria bacterium]